MKRVRFLTVVTLLVIVLLAASGPPTIKAQQPAQGAAGSQIVGLVGYMIVPDALEKSVEFYHHLLGLQLPNGDPRIKLHWYDTVPFLTEMYGVQGKSAKHDIAHSRGGHRCRTYAVERQQRQTPAAAIAGSWRFPTGALSP